MSDATAPGKACEKTRCTSQVLVAAVVESQLARTVAAEEALDPGLADRLVDGEGDPPLLRRQDVTVRRLPDATVGVGLRAERQRARHLVFEEDPVQREEVELPARLVAPRHAKRRHRIARREPAPLGVGMRVGVRNVRFDVEHRRPVEHVHAADPHLEPAHLDQLHRGHADGVRPVRRAGGEEATALPQAARREHLGTEASLVTGVAIEDEEDPQVLPQPHVLERVLVVMPLEEHDRRLGLVAAGVPLARRVRLVPERAAHEADGRERERGDARRLTRRARRQLRGALRRGTLVLSVLAAVLLRRQTSAWAHDVGISRGDYVVAGGVVEARLVFAARDRALLVAPSPGDLVFVDADDSRV